MINFLLGGISAAVAKTIVAPIERVKLILQTQSMSAAGALRRRPAYNGIADCFRKVVRYEGFQTLWRGNGINVVRYFPMTAINLGLKDILKEHFVPADKSKNNFRFLMGNILASGLGGATAVSMVYPLDFIRTRLATDMFSATGVKKYSGFSDCLMQTVRRNGIAGCYKGIGMAITGVFLFRGTSIGSYDYLKSILIKDNEKSNRTKRFMIANAVTLTSGLFCYPLDTVGRRLMI